MPKWTTPRRDDTLHVYLDGSQSNHTWLGFVEREPRPDNQRPWRGVAYGTVNPHGKSQTLNFDTAEEAKVWVATIVRMST